jgi:hypothetical protein
MSAGLVSGELEAAADRLEPRLVDEFSHLMLAGALRVLGDGPNPVRLHLFAPAVREMMNHTLRRLAPDEQVQSCSWFAPETRDGKPSRRQRASFIIRAGLSDDVVERELYFELAEPVQGIVNAVNKLNALTHVNPDTLRLGDAEIVETAQRILEAFAELLDTASDFRDELGRRLVEHCPDAVFQAAIYETIPEIDELASRHSIEWPSVDEVRLIGIDAENVEFEASGEIYATLEWGRGDDAAEMSEAFPFKAILRSSTSKPFEPKGDPGRLMVDNSGWYGLNEE